MLVPFGALALLSLTAGGCMLQVEADVPDVEITQHDLVFTGVPAAGSLGDVLVVLEPDGRVREVMPTGSGSEPTNCCLGDGALYVTLAGTGQLVAFDVGAEALPLYPAR